MSFGNKQIYKCSLLIIFELTFLQLFSGIEKTYVGEIFSEEGKNPIPVPFCKVIIISNDTSIETYSNREGIFNFKADEENLYPFYAFAQCRGYIPKLNLVQKKDKLKIKMISLQQYYVNPLYIPKSAYDTTFSISATIFDNSTRNFVSGAIAHLVDFPYYDITNEKGELKISITAVELIRIYNNEYLWVIVDHKGYNTKVIQISRSEFIKNKSFEIGNVYLQRMDRIYDLDRFIEDLNDLTSRISLMEEKFSTNNQSRDKLDNTDYKLFSQYVFEIKKYFRSIDSSLHEINRINNFLIQNNITRKEINLYKNYMATTKEQFSNSIASTNVTVKNTDTIVSEIGKTVDSVKAKTESLYDSYISSVKMPDNGLRFYTGYGFGFINRPEPSNFMKLGAKTSVGFLNRDKFYFDGSVFLNFKDTNQLFDQANLNLMYRLINRKDPYFSLEVGAGPSWGAKFLKVNNDTTIREKNSMGLNLEINLIGSLFGKNNRKNNFTKNSYFYINMSNRFVFGGKDYNYGLPVFGLGYIYNIPMKKDPYNFAVDVTYMKPSEREIIQEINLLRSNPKKYITYLESYVKAFEMNTQYINKESSTYSIELIYDTVNGVRYVSDTNITWVVRRQVEIDSVAKDLNDYKKMHVLTPDYNYDYVLKKHVSMLDNTKKQTWWESDSTLAIPKNMVDQYFKGTGDFDEEFIFWSIKPTARQLVCQLLIDQYKASGGSYYNLLDKQYTHIAICDAGPKNGLYSYILVLGRKERR